MPKQETGETPEKETIEQKATSEALQKMVRDMEGDAPKQEVKTPEVEDAGKPKIKRPAMFRRGYHKPR